MNKFFTSILFSLFTLIASASAELGGINYNINTSNCTATVIKSTYSGDLILPEIITVDGTNYSVTEVEEFAFQNSYDLTSVKLPKTITSIGALAFANGREINIYISDLSSWCSINFGYTGSSNITGYYYNPIAQYKLFLNENEIVNLEIPEDINYVCANAFSGCLSITKVSFPNNVQYIDDYAFYKCENLINVEFGNNVRTIGQYCFCKCGSIEELILPQSLETLKIGALQSMTNLKEISIPGNVQTIESGCFLRDANLSSVTFEDSEKDIYIGYGQYSGEPIFIGCPLKNVYIGRNLKSQTMTSSTGYSVPPFQNQTGLTTVTIGEEVKILDSNLFRNCSALETINTPNSLEEVGSGIFDGCTSLPIINNIRYADKCAISAIDTDMDSFEIVPGTKLILSYCFSGCKNLQSINIPDDLVYWGDGVFSGCSSLTNIIIPENVTKIGPYMFNDCENLSKIIIPSKIKSIGKYAFKNCKNIKEIVIPENVSGIYDSAFNGCESLSMIKFCDSENSIGLGTNGYSNKSIFKDCPLKDVYIGRNIGMYYYSGTQNDYLPFYNKTTLKNLTIGAKVTIIWNYSFYGCNALENVNALREDPISIDNYTFSNSIYSKCKLNVLPNSVASYSSANVWRNFQNIVEYTTSIENIQCDSRGGEQVYNLSGISSNNYYGIKIFKSANGETRKVLIK